MLSQVSGETLKDPYSAPTNDRRPWAAQLRRGGEGDPVADAVEHEAGVEPAGRIPHACQGLVRWCHGKVGAQLQRETAAALARFHHDDPSGALCPQELHREQSDRPGRPSRTVVAPSSGGRRLTACRATVAGSTMAA
ncbi:hypothetical protein P1P92_44545 [Streptomyces ipomoeae]|nr:hypothetical protein [Streptomyces ipomoeae]MDX2939341.1 hypothetical protein [Streptomyces ipomoeae]